MVQRNDYVIINKSIWMKYDSNDDSRSDVDDDACVIIKTERMKKDSIHIYTIYNAVLSSYPKRKKKKSIMIKNKEE